MGEIKPVELVKLFCGMIAGNEPLFRKAQDRLTALFGDIDIESDVFPFNDTDYYQKEMGTNLLRKFVSFSKNIDPSEIAGIKLSTNKIEQEMAVLNDGTNRRAVNLDPGYVTPDKVVLATTKNFSHRIYLRDGIFAEFTMHFKKKGCAYFDWTYPDFKSGRYTNFFMKIRQCLLT